MGRLHFYKETETGFSTLQAGAAEPAAAPDAGRERGNGAERRGLDPPDDQLGYAHPAGDLERLCAEVDQRTLELAPVIAVYRGRRIGQGDAVAQREPRAGPDLDLEALGDRHREAGGVEAPLAGPEHRGFRAGQIEAGGAGGGPRWDRQPLAVGEPGDQDLDQSTASTPARGRPNASATPG